MGLIYSYTQVSAALNAGTSDHISIKAAAARSMLLREYTYSGLGTASAANEIGVYRTTVGTIGTSGFVPHNSSASAAGAFTAVAGATPTLGVKFHSFGLNANGALFRWVAGPGMAIESGGGLQVGWRGVAGTSSATGMCIIEEI